MPDVRIEGTDTTISFPDSMSQEQILHVLRTHPQVQALRATPPPMPKIPTSAEVESTYFARQPKIPAGLTESDLSAYRQTYLKPEDTGIPKQLLDKLANLPLDKREAALPPLLSPVGRATILRAAYEQNATLPISGRIARALATSRLGITEADAKKLGVTGAVTQKERQVKQGRLAAHEQLFANREAVPDYDIESPGQRFPTAPLPGPMEVLHAPFSTANTLVGTLIAGNHQPSMMQGIAERLTPGAGAEYENVPGPYAAGARLLGGFAEPGSLMMMGGLGPVAKALSPVGKAALAGTLLGPQVVGSGQRIAKGEVGEGLAELGGLALGLGAFGLIHGAEGIKTKAEIRSFLKSGELSDNLAAKLEAIHQLEPGQIKQFPDIARELAERIVNPKKYVKLDKERAAAAQNAANRGENNPPDAFSNQGLPFGAATAQPVPFGARSPLPEPNEITFTPPNLAQETPNALPIRSAAPQVPPVAGGGETLPGGGPGVRSGQPGIEIAGESSVEVPPPAEIRPQAAAAAETAVPEAINPPNIGRAGVTSTPKGTDVPFRFAVVDAADLVPSHSEASAQPTPGYDPNMQPRDVSRPAQQAVIERIAQRLDLNRVGEAPTTADGAPLVGPDLHVESGNHRALGILRALVKYPEKYAQYVADLRAKAAEFGLSVPDNIANPVLVRINDIRFHSPESRANFAREAGESPVQRMSEPEIAASDARALAASNALMRYQPNLDLTAAGNQEFVSRFMAQVPETEHPAFLDEQGKLSQAGKERIEDAVLAAAYADKATVQRLVGAANEEAKQVGNAMRSSANAVAVLKQQIAAGAAHPLDLSSDIADAANRYLDIKRRGTTVADDLQNAEMFGPSLSPEAESLLRLFETTNKAGKVTTRSAASIGNILRYYVDAAFKQGNPAQAASQTRPVMTKLELLKAAEMAVNHVESTPDLFAERSAAETQVTHEVSPPTRAEVNRAGPAADTGSKPAQTAPKPESTGGEKLTKPAPGTALDASGEKNINEALAKLKGKGKLGFGVDPTDIPAYIQLAYGYMQKGLASAERLLAKLQEDFKENFPNVADPDFRKIYAGAKRLYEATIQAVDRNAPPIEPLPGTREAKYIGSRNVKVPGYTPEQIADLRRLHAKNRAEFEARKAQEDLAAINQAAAQPGALPDGWETAPPQELLDPVRLVAMHNATNASRARLEAARSAGDKPAIAKAEVELTQREAAYQAAANLWGKTGGVLKTLGLADAYDPVPAQRVAALLNPKVRAGTNKGRSLVTLSPQGQAEVSQYVANIRARLARTSALTPAAFAEHLPDLLGIGRVYLREIPNNFTQWLKGVQQHVDISEEQGQQIFSQIRTQKTRSTRQPTPNSQPSTTGEFTRTGSGQAVQTGLEIEPSTTGQFQPGKGKAGAQVGLEGTTPQMTGTAPEGFQIPNAPTPEGVTPGLETAEGNLGKPFEFVSDPEYREALKVAQERLEAIPQGETDATRLAARDTQAQGALADLGLFHLDAISKEVESGKLSEKSIRSQWQRRMAKDTGEWATGQVLNDVWRGLRPAAEVKAGVRSQARDILRRNMVRDLTSEQVRDFAEDLSKLDEADPHYYDKLMRLGMKYSAMSKPGWANAVQTWLAFRRAGILSSPRTIAKVLTSHGIFLGAEELAKVPASVTDSLIAHFLSGQRTLLSPKLPDILAAVRKGLTQGVREGLTIARIGEGAAERQGIQRIGSNPVDYAYGEIQSSNPLVNGYANFVTQQHAAAYRPFKVAVVAKSISEQARVILENQGLRKTNIEYEARLKSLIDNPTDEMAIQAILDAEDATFLNDNPLSSGLTTIKQAHPAVKAGVEFLLPVQKVPTNIWLKSWEYATGAHKIFTLLSPNVRAKLATDPAFQKQFSMTFGRGALGLGVIFLGAYLEQAGMLKMEKDKSKKRLGKYLLHAGGKEAELGVLAPIGTLLSVGANLNEWRRGTSTDYFADTLNLNLEQPLVRTALQFANPFDKSGAQFAANIVHPSVVPFSQALSDLAAQLDETPRDTKSPLKGRASVTQRFQREMMKKTPILRSYLPAKPGEESNRLFDPLSIRKARH
jgi:hypothetical protein